MTGKIKEHLNFAGNFVKSPKEIGAVIPSSRFASRAMLKGVNFDTATAIAEYGCGSGAFTKNIIANLQPRTKLIGLEINKNFYKKLKVAIPPTDNICLYNDSAENIKRICDNENIEHLDYVISALPWTLFNSKLQARILQSTIEAMHNDSLFINISYLHATTTQAFKRFINILESYFAEVTLSKVIWRNVPPAIVVTGKGIGNREIG